MSSSPIPDNVKNKELYRKAKQLANEKYGSKTSAYKSMYIVKTYKDRGGTYSGSKQTSKGTSKWNQEKWVPNQVKERKMSSGMLQLLHRP